MVKQSIKITNHNGIHLRPASELCKAAMEFDAEIMIKRENREYNAKSIISLLSSCTKSGDDLEIICEGSDEQGALDCVIGFIENANW